ncbi:hypothetical protein DFH28DRAFT_1190498, partial [Melampsora americana]
MLNSPIVSFAAVAFLSCAICNASDAGYSASNQPTDSSDSNHSDPTRTVNSTRPAPVMIEDSATNKRRFGANAFIGSAVRSDQQAVFKSIIDDVSIIGSFVQTKVLDSHNFGFPIEGPNYVQIKSGDSRTKTFFDSPSSGFVSSNDGITKEAYDSKPENMLFDRGGFSVSFNLDSKKLNGTHVILSWTDQIIGMDYAPHADSFLVYIGIPGNMTEAKQLAINETITSDHHTGNYMQGNSTQMFKSSGLNKRAIDMSSFMDKKIVMEFVVADQGDQVVDVACALDDFHWQSMDGMGYHQMHARGGIPGLDSIPGLGGATSGLTDGLPVISGLTGGSGSGADVLPLGRRSEDQQINTQNNHQPSDNLNFGPEADHENGQQGGDQQRQQNEVHGGAPQSQFSPYPGNQTNSTYQSGQQYSYSYGNPRNQNNPGDGQQGGGRQLIPPFAQQFIPGGGNYLFQGGQSNGHDADGNQNGGVGSFGNNDENNSGGRQIIPAFAQQFIPDGSNSIFPGGQSVNGNDKDGHQYGGRFSFGSPGPNGYQSSQIPPFAQQFTPEGSNRLFPGGQSVSGNDKDGHQYGGGFSFGSPGPNGYQSSQIPPFAQQFIPEGRNRLFPGGQSVSGNDKDGHQYGGGFSFGSPGPNGYRSSQITPFAQQFIPDGSNSLFPGGQSVSGNDKDGHQYGGGFSFGSPGPNGYQSSQIPPFAQQFIPEGRNRLFPGGQSVSGNDKDGHQYGGGFSFGRPGPNGYRSPQITPFAQQFIPDGSNSLFPGGQSVSGNDKDGHQYGGRFSFGSPGPNGYHGYQQNDGHGNGGGSQIIPSFVRQFIPDGENRLRQYGGQSVSGHDKDGTQYGAGFPYGNFDGQNGKQSSQSHTTPDGPHFWQSNLGQGRGFHSNDAGSGQPQSPYIGYQQNNAVSDSRQSNSGQGRGPNSASSGQNSFQGQKTGNNRGQQSGSDGYFSRLADSILPDSVNKLFRNLNDGGNSKGDRSAQQDEYSNPSQPHGNGAQPTSSSGPDQTNSENSPNSQNRQKSKATDGSARPAQFDNTIEPDGPDGDITRDQNEGKNGPSNSTLSSLISDIIGGSLGGHQNGSDPSCDTTDDTIDFTTNGQSQTPDHTGGNSENQASPTTDRQGSTNSEGSDGYTRKPQKSDASVESAPKDKAGFVQVDHTDDKLKRRQFLPAGVQALF